MILLVIGVDGLSLANAKDYGLVEALGSTFRWGSIETPGSTLPSCASFLTGLPQQKHRITPHGHPDEPNSILGLAKIRQHPSYLPKILAPYLVGLSGMPCTYPPEPVNGWVVTGILTPCHAINVWPHEFASEIRGTALLDEYSMDAVVQGDADTLYNTLHMLDAMPVDVLVHYYSGWNRAFAEKLWRQPVMDGEVAGIQYLMERAKAPVILWSDHGNTDMPPGYVGTAKSAHTLDGVVATNITDVELPTTLEGVHTMITQFTHGLEQSIWDRITVRYK